MPYWWRGEKSSCRGLFSSLTRGAQEMGSLEHILNKAFLGMGGGRSNLRWICEESVFLKTRICHMQMPTH